MSRRRLTVREHEAWIASGRPTDGLKIHRLLDEIEFSDELPRPQEPQVKQTEAPSEVDCQR